MNRLSLRRVAKVSVAVSLERFHVLQMSLLRDRGFIHYAGGSCDTIIRHIGYIYLSISLYIIWQHIVAIYLLGYSDLETQRAACTGYTEYKRTRRMLVCSVLVQLLCW